MGRYTKLNLIDDFCRIGIKSGDVILVRADLGSVGRVEGGAAAFLDALLAVVGAEGTVVSLAFTDASFIRKPRIENAFHPLKESYAGALPNLMIRRADAFRSRHPMCSYVAIGKYAREVTRDHDQNSPAYEPIRRIVELGGRNLLVGCVDSSPGFTTTHLAEQELGLLKLVMFSNLFSTYYQSDDGEYKIFRRRDAGLCSLSFYKFYSHYVRRGVLVTGYIGRAYSIAAPAKDCYEIERQILLRDKSFNVCDSADCFTCNANRFDRLYRLPYYLARLVWRRFAGGKND